MRQGTLGRLGAPYRDALSPAAALVRRHDRDRFQTALFAPAADREALFALYAFNYEIARVRESVAEPMLGQIRLQWWRETIAAIFAGGTPRRHDVVEAIAAAIGSRHLSREHFDRLIDAREHDFDPEPAATLAMLEDYAEGTSATLVYLALEVLGADGTGGREAARHVGIAYGLAGLLRAIPFHAAVGRSAIPPGLPVQAVAAAASGHLAAARALRRTLPAAALPALLPARVAEQVLKRLERAGFDPFASGVATSDPVQAWRLAGAALTRRF